MKTNEDILNIVYEKNPKILYEKDDNDIITILEKQDKGIQRFFRKIGFRIPEYKRMELDEFSSFVFLLIDGRRNVEDIGIILDERFGERIHPIYERLLLFLNHIDVNCNYINKMD